MKKILTTKSGKQLELVANLGTDQFYKMFTGHEIEADAIELSEMRKNANSLSGDEKTKALRQIASTTLSLSKNLAFIMSTQAKFFGSETYVRQTMGELTEEKLTEFLCGFERTDFDLNLYKEIFALWNGQSQTDSEIKNLEGQLHER